MDNLNSCEKAPLIKLRSGKQPAIPAKTVFLDMNSSDPFHCLARFSIDDAGSDNGIPSSIVVVAPDDATSDVEPFWLDPGGDPEGKRNKVVTVAGEDVACLVIEQAALKSLIESSLDQPGGGGFVDLVYGITVKRGRSSGKPSNWTDIRFRVIGRASAPRISASLSPRSILVDSAVPDQPEVAASIIANIPPELAYTGPGDARIGVEIRLSDELLRSESQLARLSANVSPAAGLRELRDLGSATAGTPMTQVFVIDNPAALGYEKHIEFQLHVNALQLLDDKASVDPEKPENGAFEIWKYPFEIRIGWIGEDDQWSMEWGLENAKFHVELQRDRHEWVSIAMGREKVKLSGDSVPPEVRLEQQSVDIPSSFGDQKSLVLDSLFIRFITNIAASRPLEFDISIATGSGDIVAQATDEWWFDPGNAGTVHFLAGQVVEHQMQFNKRGLEKGLAEHVAKLLEVGKQPSSLEVTIQLQKPDDAADGTEPSLGWLPPIRFALNLIEEEQYWPICIDVGMSASTVWVQWPAAEHSNVAGDMPVHMGYMHQEIERFHGEVPPAGSDEGLDSLEFNKVWALLPSRIGISDSGSLRTRFRPLSFGDLSLSAEEDEDALQRRLQHFRRHHSISLPVPENVPDDMDTEVVSDLKKQITNNQPNIPLNHEILRHDPEAGTFDMVSRIQPHELLADFIDELLRLYVARVLFEKNTRGSNYNLNVEDEEIASVLSNPRLVLTHPSGIGDEQVQVYKQAARHVLGRISGGFVAPGEDIDQLRMEPVLILESAASACEAIERLSVEDRLSLLPAKDGESLIVALDIGAGTFDVSILELKVSQQNYSYQQLASFGLPIAGDRLDETIMQKISSLLVEAFSQEEVTRELGELSAEIQTLARGSEPEGAASNNRLAWFKNSIRKAKLGLSEQAKKRAKDTNAYRVASDDRLYLLIHQRSGSKGASHSLLSSRPNFSASKVISCRVRDAELKLHLVSSTDTPPDGSAADPDTRIYLEVPGSVLVNSGNEDGTARDAYQALISNLSDVIPSMALDHANGLRPSLPVNVVLTGRTSLWPPLHHGIRQTIEDSAADARLVDKVPWLPHEMKTSVILGAKRILLDQQERRLLPKYRNPLAIVETRYRSRPTKERMKHAEQPLTVSYLNGADADTDEDNVLEITPGAGSRLCIARVLPGLHHRKRLKTLTETEPEARLFLEIAEIRASSEHSGPLRITAHGGESDRWFIKVEQDDWPTRHFVIRGDKLFHRLVPDELSGQ